MTPRQLQAMNALALDALSDPAAPQALRSAAWRYVTTGDHTQLYALLVRAAKSMGLV